MLNLETFKAYWDKAFPDVSIRRSHFLLAVSGGVDSIVLAHLMHEVKAECTVAHVNFQLRGEESLRDELFVENFAMHLQMPFKVYHSETKAYADSNKMGIQQAAREIRYEWFSNLLLELTIQENESDKPKQVILLTAHHEDDNVETILMQLFRGTGLHGLTGIPTRRNDNLNLARPLLSFSKSEILAYANANGLSFVEDSSNEKNDYTRNLIRNTLLPEIAAVFPMVSKNIITTSKRLKESEQIVTEAINSFWNKGLKNKKGILTIPISYWNKVIGNDTYTYALITKYGFSQNQIEEIYKLLIAKQGAFITSATHKLIKWADQILIVNSINEKEYFPINEEILELGFLKTLNGSLNFEIISNIPTFEINPNPKFAFLDADKIQWPLLIRTAEMNDYFYPLGLRKKKKLNHFLASLKLSPPDKSKISVIYSGEKLVWVVGHRIDDRFKITNNTKKVLKISYQ